jgi:hypothetical protein
MNEQRRVKIRNLTKAKKEVTIPKRKQARREVATVYVLEKDFETYVYLYANRTKVNPFVFRMDYERTY